MRFERAATDSHKLGRMLLAGGVLKDIIAPPPGELSSETSGNSVAILLTYATARALLTGDVEVREEYMAEGSYTNPLTVIKV